MVGCGPGFLDQWSICCVTEVKGKYQQEEGELDDVKEEAEPGNVIEIEKQESET